MENVKPLRPDNKDLGILEDIKWKNIWNAFIYKTTNNNLI